MSVANLYGRIVSANAVESAVAASLGVWISDYLGELERIEGYGPNTIERPRGVVTASEFEKWPEDELPVIIIVSAGIRGRPVRRGDGTYEAPWNIGISPIVSDRDAESTRKLATTYAAAIRAALVQHKMLRSPLHPEGFANFLEWEAETYIGISFGESRTLGTAQVVFTVGVEGVVQSTAGPREPIPDPTVDPGPWPNVKPPIKVIVDPRPLAGALT